MVPPFHLLWYFPRTATHISEAGRRNDQRSLLWLLSESFLSFGTSATRKSVEMVYPTGRISPKCSASKAFGISLFLEGQDFLYTWYLWIYNIQHTFQAPKGVGKFKNHCQKTTFNESKFSMLEKNPVKITSWDLSASTCKANPEGIPFWYLILVPSGGTNIFPLKLGPA